MRGRKIGRQRVRPLSNFYSCIVNALSICYPCVTCALSLCYLALSFVFGRGKNDNRSKISDSRYSISIPRGYPSGGRRQSSGLSRRVIDDVLSSTGPSRHAGLREALEKSVCHSCQGDASGRPEKKVALNFATNNTVGDPVWPPRYQ